MSAPRGQNLLLFSLTVLLVAVMVLMTAGLASRIHDRQDLQVASDAAAYSQAVATSRAFNAVAAENRVLVAQMASIAAAQSMLSWVGFYHGVLNQARDALFDMKGQNACGVGVFDAACERIKKEDRRLIELFEPLKCGYEAQTGRDWDSGAYVRLDLYQTALDIAKDQRELYTDMVANLPGVAQRVAERANLTSKWASTGGEYRVDTHHSVSVDELDAAVEPLQQHGMDMLQVTMATRGVDPFISSRGPNRKTQAASGAAFIMKRLQAVIEPTPLSIVVTDIGTAYFGDDGPQVGAPHDGETEGYDGEALNPELWWKWLRIKNPANSKMQIWGAWGTDVGRFRFVWNNPPPGCNVKLSGDDAFGYLLSTGPGDQRDNHMWRRGNSGYGDYRERNDPFHVHDWCESRPRHTFKRVPDEAVDKLSIWPVFTDFQTDRLVDRSATRTAPGDLWGQPKSMVALSRNYAARGQRKDPWNLNFSFQFGRGGSGTTLDLSEKRPGEKVAVAVSAGISYYHRGDPLGGSANDHAQEPPNFLSPFWRATLVASDVDETWLNRGKDVERTLTDINEPSQASTLSLLRTKGFGAMP